MAQQTLSGRCLCGTVRYECGSSISNAAFCHCESCRRAAGAHVVAWMTVRRADFKYTQGAPQQFASSPPVIRSFCGRCGTPLTYWHKESPDTIDVTVSTLENPGVITPTDHIWMDDAVAWDRPADELPRYRTTRAAGMAPP
jgi:hypothetical protein